MLGVIVASERLEEPVCGIDQPAIVPIIFNGRKKTLIEWQIEWINYAVSDIWVVVGWEKEKVMKEARRAGVRIHFVEDRYQKGMWWIWEQLMKAVKDDMISLTVTAWHGINFRGYRVGTTPEILREYIKETRREILGVVWSKAMSEQEEREGKCIVGISDNFITRRFTPLIWIATGLIVLRERHYYSVWDYLRWGKMEENLLLGLDDYLRQQERRGKITLPYLFDYYIDYKNKENLARVLGV